MAFYEVDVTFLDPTQGTLLVEASSEEDVRAKIEEQLSHIPNLEIQAIRLQEADLSFSPRSVLH